MKILAAIALFFFISCCSCSPQSVKQVSALDEIQGKWKVIEATDPDGNGFEAEDDVKISIEGNQAKFKEATIKLDFVAGTNYHDRCWS